MLAIRAPRGHPRLLTDTAHWPVVDLQNVCESLGYPSRDRPGGRGWGMHSDRPGVGREMIDAQAAGGGGGGSGDGWEWLWVAHEVMVEWKIDFLSSEWSIGAPE